MATVLGDITSPRDLPVQAVVGTTHVLAVRADGSVVRVTLAALLAEVDDRADAAVAAYDTAHLAAYTHT